MTSQATRTLDAGAPIAVVGMACRYPRAASPAEFWQLLHDGVDAITEVPAHRWDVDAFFDAEPAKPSKMYTRWGGFVEAVDQFDPAFFGISLREAQRMDPQQRMLLEVAWEALEDAAIPPDSLQDSATGVFVGICNSDYRLLGQDLSALDAYVATGTCFCIAANRLSYSLNLRGPSLAVDTACSSSLVAVHLACQSLKWGESDLAIVGGVNLILSPAGTVALCQARMMASNGRCKTFDASADGYVRGEGCGVVVLKRLSDALADADPVLAVISGSAVNQDGLTNGLTAPNGPSQQAVLRAALAAAGRRPHEVSFIETHGTGTSLGDPIEVRSLRNVLMENRPADRLCWLGAVKTNIGHLESAAGIAGLQKLVLAIQHKQIPPNLHFQNLNPLITLDGTALRLPVEVTNWRSDAAPRVAGVSSFGFGGTNCHVIVEQPPARPRPPSGSVRPVHLLALSGKSDRALLDTATRFAACAANLSADEVGDLCCTANVGRSKFRWRKAIVAADMTTLRRELDQFANNTVDQLVAPPRVGKKAPKVAFLFTGQGSQHVNMGRQLYDHHRVFREQLDRCDALLRTQLPQPLLSVLFPQDGDSTLLNETAYTQPALFALEYALARLWMSWGIHPQAAMGHSVGEYVACCLADVFSLEDGLRLVAARGRLMQQLPRDGRMVVVFAAEEMVAEALVGRDRDVAIAAVNAPNQTVISGRVTVVDSVVHELQQQGVRCSGLTVSHAFHSPLMDPMLAEFRKFVEGVQFSAPAFEVISNVTGESGGEELQNPEYWCQHIRQAVRFADSMHCLAKKKPAVFLEIGPKPILTAMGQACVTDESTSWLSSLRGRDDDCRNMFTSLGRLFESGAIVDWQAFSADCQFTKIALPTYPFQHQRCWIEFDAPRRERPASAGANNGHDTHPLFDLRMEVAGKETVYQTTLSADRLGYLGEHQVFDAVVVPAALFAELALSAGQDRFGTAAATLNDLVIRQAMKLDPDHPRLVQVVIGQKDGASEFRIYSQSRSRAQSGGVWSLHASGNYGSGSVAGEPAPGTRELLSKAMTTDVDIDHFYASRQANGLAYGPAFRCLQELKCGAGEAVGEVRLPELLREQAGAHQLHPALLDGCLQVILAALPDSQLQGVYLPAGLELLQIHRTGLTSVWSHVRIRPESVPGGLGVIADIRLLDAEDQVVAIIQGLELRRMHRRMLARQLQPPHQDWLYRVEWQVKSLKSRPAPIPCLAGSCLILADDQGVGVELAEQMRSRGQRCVVVHAAARYARLSRDEFQVCPREVGDMQLLLKEALGDEREAPQRVVHLWSLSAVPFADLSHRTLDQSLRICCETTLNLLHALVNIREKHPPGLWLVTRGSQAIGESQSVVEPLPACLWGMARVIGWEHPLLRPVCIDLDPERLGDDVAHLMGEILEGALTTSWHFVGQSVLYRASCPVADEARTNQPRRN